MTTGISQKGRAQKKRPVAKAKAKKKIPKPYALRNHGWMVTGFDISLSSMAGAAIVYDKALNKFKGPYFATVRWTKEDHYFDRLVAAVKSHELVLNLQALAKVSLRTDEVFIAQEEPFPPHGKFMAKGTSQSLKQQAEISGAFMGGVLRYGFREFWQFSNMTWRSMVAGMISEETGEDVTTYPKKFKSEKLAKIYNCKYEDSGKFRSKQWALDVMGPFFGQQFQDGEIPDWPDLQRATGGHKVRQDKAKAFAFQPDDRYDALAVMWALYLDLVKREPEKFGRS